MCAVMHLSGYREYILIVEFSVLLVEVRNGFIIKQFQLYIIVSNSFTQNLDNAQQFDLTIEAVQHFTSVIAAMNSLQFLYCFFLCCF